MKTPITLSISVYFHWDDHSWSSIAQTHVLTDHSSGSVRPYEESAPSFFLDLLESEWELDFLRDSFLKEFREPLCVGTGRASGGWLALLVLTSRERLELL